MRVIFYAEPKDPDCIPKQEADSESICAQWLTIEEFKSKDKIRGDELIEYSKHV